MRGYKFHDMNWIEPAVMTLGGVKAAAKAMGVTQGVMKRWLRQGRIQSIKLARRMEKKAGIWWQLIYWGPDFEDCYVEGWNPPA